jgi:serine/threonine protein kinase
MEETIETGIPLSLYANDKEIRRIERLSVLKFDPSTDSYFFHGEDYSMTLREFIYYSTPYEQIYLGRAAQIWAILEQLIEGLSFVHSQKVAHRNLNPSNGMLPINTTFD